MTLIVIPIPRRSKTRIRFSLRLMLCFMSALCISIAVVDYRRRELTRRTNAVERLSSKHFFHFRRLEYPNSSWPVIDKLFDPEGKAFPETAKVGPSYFSKGEARYLSRIDLELIGCLTSLEHLTITGCHFEDKCLSPLKTLENLTSVALDDCNIDDTSLATLAGLPKLRSIYADGTDVTDAGIAHLVASRRVATLSLRRTATRGSTIRFLKSKIAIQELFLEDSPICDDGLKPLPA